MEQLKDGIRAATNRNDPRPLEVIIMDLNAKLRGWLNYFRLARLDHICPRLDRWIRRRLRCLKLKQCKTASGQQRFLSGIAPEWLLKKGEKLSMGRRWWYNAKTRLAHYTMTNKWFEELGLYSLQKSYQEFRNRRMR
ncbi:MAG: hypothetical protein IKB96_09535 [Prevotella sp.]|nr:hypothetical protein [Prevotella sp.]MBR3695389.1 hypothetical protein [Akkermansia sp.]